MKKQILDGKIVIGLDENGRSTWVAQDQGTNTIGS